MRHHRIALLGLVAALAVLLPAGAATGAAERTGYLVVLSGTETADGFDLAGTEAAVSTLVASAGGTIERDLTGQIGVLFASSASPAFADALRASPLVESVGSEFRVKALPDGGPEPVDDLAEAAQWDMEMIRTDEAHAVQGGAPSVDVGVLDTGIDGKHPDFRKGLVSNVDCVRGHNSIGFMPDGPGVGLADPCVDNQFHGTHVAGTIAARANGIGVVGVAPNVTLVPIKVCDSSGYCYASAVVDGITYAGDRKLDVINMSFFVDDDEFQESTEFKCLDDPTQRTFRQAVERALKYARKRGVTPVAALGNSDEDLGNPSEADGDSCDVVPAESPGVIGTASVGARSQKASYSNYGWGATDVTAPGGAGTTGDCTTTVLSTIPGGYGCFQGTSMASPHAAGVAALIVSQFGKVGKDGDVEMSPGKVQEYLQETAIDIGEPGYDGCFGHGRIDALRAVQHDTSPASDPSAPACPEVFGPKIPDPPNDPYYDRQWGLDQVNARQAWAYSTGKGQVIAIVDSGVDLEHPDLRSKLVRGATFTGCAEVAGGCGNGDWESGNTPDEAPSPHGTHVAGIAAAVTGNGVGIAGVARNAKLMPVKVLTDEGGSFEEVAAGIRWAADHGADVVNLSLGALPGIQALPLVGELDDAKQAINYAVSKGVVVVAAAGNEFASICAEPGFNPNALCVVATDRNEVRAAYSNFAVDQDLNVVAAPGGAAVLSCADDVISTVPAGAEGFCSENEDTPGYDYYAGTSMATPHVAGVAALLTAQGRDVFQVYQVLRDTARTPEAGTRGTYTPVYGWGIVDAAAAVAAP